MTLAKTNIPCPGVIILIINRHMEEKAVLRNRSSAITDNIVYLMEKRSLPENG